MPNVVDARDLLHCPGGVQSMTHHDSFTYKVENRGAPVLMLPWTTLVAVLGVLFLIGWAIVFNGGNVV